VACEASGAVGVVLEHRTGQSISGFPFGESEVWLVNPGRECVMSHSRAPGRPTSQKNRASWWIIPQACALVGDVPAGCP
jgi:hypothetical protein